MGRVYGPLPQVGAFKLVKSTGYDLKIQTRAMPGCAVGWVNRVHLQLCTDEDSVDLRMFDR